MTEHDLISLLAAVLLSGPADSLKDVETAVAIALDIRTEAGKQLHEQARQARPAEAKPLVTMLHPSPHGATEEYARGWNDCASALARVQPVLDPRD